MNTEKIPDSSEVKKLNKELEEARKKIEELEKDSFFLNTLLANTPDHIYFKDEKSRFVKLSDSMFDFFGKKTAAGCIGKSDADFFSPEHALQALEDEKKIMKTGKGLINVEEQETWKKKTDAWVSTTKLPLKSENGKTIGTFGISRTITAKKKLEIQLQEINNELEQRVRDRTKELEKLNRQLSAEIATRKHAEEELQQEKDLLSVTISSIGEAIITTDINGKITLLNDMAEKITGWPKNAAEKKNISKIMQLKERFGEAQIESPVSDILKNQEETCSLHECVLIDRNRNEHIINSTASAIHDLEGNIIGSVVVFRDITQQIKLKEEYTRSKNIQSLGNLASGIAHDFNNYLAGIIGNLNLMKLQQGLNIELQTLVDSAERATRGARKLALQLLTFAKGGDSLHIQTDVKQLISQRLEAIFAEDRYKYEIKTDKDIWPINIDTAQIEQVLSSILENSLEAMHGGGNVLVNIQNREIKKQSSQPLDPGKYIRITITDNGSGISSEHLEKVFMPYFSTKKTKSGLGLTTSYSIIQKHKGTITVKQAKNGGTEVIIHIPSEEEKPVEEKQEKTAKKKILYMDDNELLLDVTGKMIASLGYEAVCVTDGTKALEAFRMAYEADEKYYAVIMDLTIPGGIGAKEIIKDLKEIDPDIFTVISSGYTTDKAITGYKKYGFNAVITKPFTIDDLKEALISRPE